MHTITPDIIAGCVNGDTKCQRILYESMYRKMLGVCLRYASGIDDAKDMLHDGFIKVFEKLKDFRYEGSIEGYIRKIIVNTAIDQLRQHPKLVEYEQHDEGEYDVDMTELQADGLKVERIIGLIQSLSPAYKAVFNLYVIENYTHKEISKKMGISENTSKTNLFKAKLRLRQMYTDKYVLI